MMDPLPFELDSPELLEAAAAALAALTPVPAQERTAVSRRTETAPVDTVLQWEGAADPAVLRTLEDAPETGIVFSRLDLAAIGAGLSPEALSREIERDARRFE